MQTVTLCTCKLAEKFNPIRNSWEYELLPDPGCEVHRSFRWSLSIDEFLERAGSVLEKCQDGKDGHTAIFSSTSKEGAARKVTTALVPLVLQLLTKHDENAQAS